MCRQVINLCISMCAEDFNPRIMYAVQAKYNEKNRGSFHSHDFCVLTYIISGSCTYKIGDMSYEVKKGDVLFCNPGVSHGRHFLEGQEIIEFQTGFNNLWLKNMKKDCLINEGDSPVIKPVKYEAEFIKCCDEIIAEKQKNEPGYELILKSLIMKLIVIFIKETLVEIEASESLDFEYYDKTTIVNTIISYMNDNYMKAISLDRISKNTYLSPVYISKLFKELTGDSPINYLIKIRLSKAQELLREGHMTIKVIAKSVGYDDAYYFSKLFKKYYKLPPSKFILKG